MRVITSEPRESDVTSSDALAQCPECHFYFDPRQYAGDWPCCGPRCARRAKARLRADTD